MKAAVWTARERIEIQDLPLPPVGSGDALVRMRAVGVCGTDLHIWLGDNFGRTPPLVLGHEMCGEVVEAPGAEHVKPGDCVSIYPMVGCGRCMHCAQGREVLCRHRKPRGIYAAGGFAEYLGMPAANLYRLDPPAGAAGAERFKLGALAEPLATALHFTNAAARDRGPAAILGLGPIGLSILLVAKHRGFEKIAAVESNPNRAAVAKKLGADLVVNANDSNVRRQLEDFFGEDGCSVVWNTAAVAPARLLALDLVRSGGLVVELGMAQQHTSIDFTDLVRREIRLAGSHAYSRAEFAEAGRLVMTGQINTTDWVEVAPLSALQSVLEDLHRPDTSRAKVVIQP